MFDRFKNLFINFKNILLKIKGLWQSKDEKYIQLKFVGKLYLVISLILLIVGLSIKGEADIGEYVLKVMILYIAIVFIMFSINFFSLYLYIFSKKTFSIKNINFIYRLILTFLIFTIVFSLPFAILVIVTNKFIDYRDGKVNTKAKAVFLCMLTIMFVSLFLCFNIIFSNAISELICNVIAKFDFYINKIPVIMFIAILLCRVEAELLFFTLTYIYKFVKKKESKTIEDDIRYLKNSSKKLQLIVLIFIFFVAIFEIFPSQSVDFIYKAKEDIINVATVYTLIILYMDKRKEWKN